MNQSERERMEEFLGRQKHMVIAVTLDDGTPWAVPVAIKNREGDAFEWDSRLDTVHSKAIENHPIVALTIFEPRTDRGPEYGFYARAKAEKVRESDKGYGRYRATVEKSWINDESFQKREVSHTKGEN
jgi:hypothetical protein